MPYDGATTQQTNGKQPPNVFSGLPFDQLLYQWALYIRECNWYHSDLVRAATTLHIRARGVTISDMVGYFSTSNTNNGRWLNYDPQLDGSVHPLNIVGPSFATNKNACLQANAQLEVRSANESAAHKQLAQKWQRISDYFERTGWDETKRAFIFDDIQKGGTLLVETTLEECDKTTARTVEEGKRALAVYQCSSCGSQGLTALQGDQGIKESVSPKASGSLEHIEGVNDFQVPPDAADEGDEAEAPKLTQIPCPQCQQPANARVHLMDGLNVSENDVPEYDIDDQLIPFFNFTVDTYGAKIDGLDSAGWVQVQKLRDLMYMLTNYPGRTFSGPSQWSYPLRCDYALAQGQWAFLNYQPREIEYGYGHERYEEQTIYLHEDSYKAYRAPADYEFVNAFGDTTFKIKKGQSIGEAQEAIFGENYHGFKFSWCETQLLTIFDASKEETHFRKRFADVHWSRESGGYLSSPNFSVIYIQDDITLTNTLNHNIAVRNAHNPTYYDSTYFDEADFSKEFIGTKKAALLPDGTMAGKVMQLPMPTPSPYVVNQLQFLWGIKDTVTQVTPAMRGESQQGAPYAAQRQQLEQSMGNLTSVLKSFAQCKVRTFKNKAHLAKRFWTLEQFEQIGSMFGETWTEEDVEEMCAVDLDKDLIVSYVNGTEMPSTPMSREMKFYAALSQLIPLIQVAPGALPPDAMTQILKKVDEYGEFDFDLTGLEVGELIAQKRYSDLVDACMQFQSMTFEQVQAMKQQVVGMQPPSDDVVKQSMQMAQQAPEDPNVQEQAKQMVQPTPISQLDVLTEKIFNQAGIRFNQFERLDLQKDLFVEYLNNEIGQTKENYVLIEMMTTLITLLDQASQSQSNAEMAKNPQIQAAQAADEAQKEDRQMQFQIEGMKLASDDKNQAADRQLEGVKIIADHAGKERDLVAGLLNDQADREHQSDESTKAHVSTQMQQEAAAENEPAPSNA